jgi:hypothetical protein
VNIPDEAVEAAEKVVLLYIDLQLLEHDPERRIPKEAAREILEAAAPHIADRAYNAGHLDGMMGAPNNNPFRSQA